MRGETIHKKSHVYYVLCRLWKTGPPTHVSLFVWASLSWRLLSVVAQTLAAMLADLGCRWRHSQGGVQGHHRGGHHGGLPG